MRSTFKVGIAASAALALVAMGSPLAASADDTAIDTAECVVSEAYTETVEHPAVGEPTIVVDNPNYIAPTYLPAWTEHVPAVYTPAIGTPTIKVEIDNPDYVPAVPATDEVPAIGTPTIEVEQANPDHVPAVDATYATEYEYKQWITGKIKWKDSADWNPGLGWYATGNTRSVEVTPAQPAQGTPTIIVTVDNPDYVPAVPATEGTPAIGEPTIIVTVDNPDYVAPTYVAAHDVEHPAVYTPPVGVPTIVVDNPDYVAARTEVIEHEAVDCPAVIVPVDDKGDTAPVTPTAERLAFTGAGDGYAVAGGLGGLSLLAGLIAMTVAKLRGRITE